MKGKFSNFNSLKPSAQGYHYSYKLTWELFGLLGEPAVVSGYQLLTNPVLSPLRFLIVELPVFILTVSISSLDKWGLSVR